MGSKRRGRPSAVVPRSVFGLAFAGVVPACVLAACSSSSTSAPQLPSVAAACFDGSTNPCYGVAQACFDGSTNPGCPQPNPDATSDGLTGDGTADGGVDAGEAGDGFMMGVADTGFGVADAGFGG